MKIIKPLLLLTICICTTTILSAQELKPEPAKPVAIKIPDDENKPSPEFRQQPVTPPTKTISSVVAEKPSPREIDENLKPTENAKPVALTIDADAATKKLTAQQLKTSNGISERPKVPTVPPNTIDHNARPVTVTKPAVVKGEQKQ